ncbi:helix-turn-helix transcriptional regulator [Flavobacterium plurextorum]|nr:helix-turn-helix domain-containing protein [Flavobacterium plurextorum]UUW08751.1 helix-turn-helix transcriptional regulator [Flavobacterium plurextorum]
MCNRAVKDALDVLRGSWKLPILVSLTHSKKRFKEIAKDVNGISDKMLSKELKDLEMNHLVKRTVYDTFPPTVEYSITEHTATLNNVMDALSEWGTVHRIKIIGK